MNPLNENSSNEENPNVIQQATNKSLPINVSGSSPVSANASALSSNLLTPPSINIPNKRVIRKITPIDPKKLQQAGLDRKIAEALSKQKSQKASSNQSLQRFKKFLKPSTATTSNVSSLTSNTTTTAAASGASDSLAAVANAQQQIISSSAKPVTSPKTIIPPKITITGPESPSEIERQNLAGLNSQQRLEHVKNLLNKKLLQKKAAPNNDTINKTQSNQLLKPPPINLNAGALSVNAAYKNPLKVGKSLPVQPPKEVTKSPQLYVKLKEPQEMSTPPQAMKLPTKPKTPQKSPQDIARKLDFQNEADTAKTAGQQVKRNVVKILNKDINNEIPKAAIKTGVSNTIMNLTYAQNSPAKTNATTPEFPKKLNVIKPSLNDIPKASIKPGQNQTSYSYLTYGHKHSKFSEQKLDFPEVSPLKVAFPTVNVPKETPLPTIDSFKKPYPLVNVGYYNLHSHQGDKLQNQVDYINYETSLYQQLPSPPVDSIVSNNLLNIQLPVNPANNQEMQQQTSAPSTAQTPANNCLIVLENKVLSQDEMIDLTELRLSTTNAPRFIHPHKPIPEVVIKQEKTDEYTGANSPESKEKDSRENEPTPPPTAVTQEEHKDLNSKINKETSNNVMLLTTKQNKKIIINAQKLKLPPQQIADLAKKIKQSTTQTPPSGGVKGIVTIEAQTANKSTDIRILNTKASYRKLPSINSAKQNVYNVTSNPVTGNKSKDISGYSLIKQNNACLEPSKKDPNYPLNKTEKQVHNNINKPNSLVTKNNNHLNANEDHSMITVKEEPTTLETSEKFNYNSEQNNSSYHDLNSTEYRHSAVEIIDEPLESEDCFSAVDFIASLNNTHPITEDTTMELSPEELNLMNVTPLSMHTETTQYSHITSTPKLDHNNLNHPDMGGTIVIESSKGPETILTSDSPNKKYGELQKVNRFCNLEVCDMDIEEPLETTQQFVLEPLKEPQNIDLTNVIVAKDPEKIKRIISQVKNVNDFDNVNSLKEDAVAGKTVSVIKKINSPLKGLVVNPFSAKDKLDGSSLNQKENNKNLSVIVANKDFSMTTQESLISLPKQTEISKDSANQILKALEKTDVELERTSESLQLTKGKQSSKPEEEQQDTSFTNSREMSTQAGASLQSNNVLPAKVSDIPKPLETIEVSEPIPSAEYTKALKSTKTLESAQSLKTVKINEVSVEKPDQAANEESENQTSQKELKTSTTSILPGAETSKKSSNEIQETEKPKTSESSASTMVASKRISRFKKGKINLVQRNKTGVQGAPNKTQPTEKKIENDKEAAKEITNKEVNETKTSEEVMKGKKEVEDLQAKESLKDPTQKEIASQIYNTGSEDLTKSNEQTVAISSDLENSQNTGSILQGNLENKKQIKQIVMESNVIENEHTNTVKEGLQNTIESSEIKKSSSSINLQETLPKALETSLDKGKINELEPLRDDAKSLSSDKECIAKVPVTSSQSPQKSPVKTAAKNRQSKATEAANEVAYPELNLIQHKPTEAPNEFATHEENSIQNKSKEAPLEVTTSEESLTQEKPIEADTPMEEKTPEVTLQQAQLTPKTPELQSNFHQDNIENIPCENITSSTDDLNSGSKAILKNMRNAKVSLIDIVKHSPNKQNETSPVIPFKKVCKDGNEKSPEVKGIQNLLKQLKTNQKELDESNLEIGKEENKTKDNGVTESCKEVGETKEKELNKSSEKVRTITTRRSSRCCLKSNETVAELTTPTSATAKAATSRKRHSTRPLISDDDLEFLPVNAEVKFKLSKSQQKENELETPKSCGITHRRTRLYSKPLEMELIKTNTIPLTKRTRYYSQTLETNVTIEFDTLKTPLTPKTPTVFQATLPAINSKSLDTEDSCHDSNQESGTMLTPSKQRKRLRKTLEDIKKSQKPATDSDSEDDNRDYDCSLKDCEESNEFLGFEENTESNSSKMITLAVNEKENNDAKSSKTKGGTLKNWLTTGKAIAPTFKDTTETSRIPPDDDSTSTGIRAGKGGIVPLKKRWDLTTNHQEETDITDDTSPADDEDEEEGNRAKAKEFPHRIKRGIKNVIDSNKELIDSKKIKLDFSKTEEEHRFIKPRHLRTSTSKNSGTDSDFHDEGKGVRVEKPKLRVKNFLTDTNSPNIFSEGAVVGKESFTESATDSDCQEVRTTRRLRGHADKLKSDNESDNSQGKESAKADKRRSRSFRKETHSENSAVESDHNDKTDKKEVKTTEKDNVQKKTLDVSARKEPAKTKQITEVKDIKPDTELISLNSDSEVSKNKRSRRSLVKTLAKENLNKKEEIQEIGTQDSLTEEPKESLEKKQKPNRKSSKKQNKDKSKENLETKEKENVNTIENSPKKEEAITETPKDETTPQITTTSKKRKRGTKGKTEETPTTRKEEFLNDTQTTVKRRLSSETSGDEQPITSAKKRGPKTGSKRKLKIEDSDSDSVQTPLKTDAPHQSAIDNLTPIATPHLALVKNETSTPGRKRKVDAAEANFNPRLLLITKREQLETDEVITVEEQGTGPIQCGLCLQRTQATKWTLHLAQHYGVGWKVGEEKVNIENRTNVLNIMVNYMKVTHCKGLICRMCKKQYRSALGLLMHLEICGAQDIRVICEYCKKDYAKNSLPIHIRSCPARFIETSTPTEETAEKKEEVFGNTGRLKRHSTIKAESKLKEIGQELEKATDGNTEFDPKTRIRYVPPPNVEEFIAKWTTDLEKLGTASCSRGRCKFTSNDINEFKDHMKKCKTFKSGYFCNFCRQKAFKSEKDAIDHVLKNHRGGVRRNAEDSDCDMKFEDEQSSDDYDLSEGVDEDGLDDFDGDDDEDFDDVIKDESNRKKKNNKKRNMNLSVTYRQQVFDGRYNDISKEILKKWKNFLKANYSCEPLFAEFTTQYSVLNLQDYKKYLPNQTQSMKFNFKINKSLTAKVGVPEDNLEWSELKRYESITNKRNTYYFLGAPIKLCSWLPLPAHINEQYLAVVYRADMFKFIKFLQPKQHHTIILIFKVIVNNHIPQLTVHYGLVIEDGPVHHISFLPSGGYDENNNRLSLMAVATVNSVIKVYSLPLKVQEDTKEDKKEDITENITLLEVKPKFVLNIDMLEQNQGLTKTQCMQICWSEFTGHQHIFASFSNGFIGIWDITNDPQQNLNHFVVDDIINYAALNYFYIGEKCVKSLALHYDTNGPRWLALSGAYRKFVIYDIKCFMQPLILKEECNKNILLSMDWCPLMETLLYSYCDAMPNNGRCVMNVNPTHIMFPQNKLDYMVCGVTQVHYTPLTNICVASMENGDLLFMDTRELHYEYPLGKKFGERRLLYTLDIKQLNGEPIVRLPKGNQKNINEKVPNDWLMHDDKYKEKYGLVFQSLIRLREQDKSAYLHENRSPPPNVIPYMRINTLRCNLNANAKSLVALGYENGFLRIVDFNKDNFSS